MVKKNIDQSILNDKKNKNNGSISDTFIVSAECFLSDTCKYARLY